jgi:hypothetical protein
MHSRILAITVTVLATFTVGTSRLSAEGPHSYGSVQASCAPWDGAAVEVRLTSEPAHCGPSKGPFVSIAVWRGLPLHAGQTVKFGPGSDAGTASRCLKEGDCQAARSGTVVFDRFGEGKGAAGRYELIFRDGEVVKGSFDVAWCPVRTICG